MFPYSLRMQRAPPQQCAAPRSYIRRVASRTSCAGSECCAPACRAQQRLQSHVHAAQDACRRAAAVVANAAAWQLSEAGVDDFLTVPPATEEPQQVHDTTAGQEVMHEDEVVAAAAAVMTFVDEFNTAGTFPIYVPPLVMPAVPEPAQAALGAVWILKLRCSPGRKRPGYTQPHMCVCRLRPILTSGRK